MHDDAHQHSTATTVGEEDRAPRPGRIALLLPALAGGGAERVFLEMARGLVERAVDVDVVVVRAHGPLLDQVPAGARLVSLDAGRTVLAGPSLWRYLRRERPAAVVSALNPTNLLNAAVTRLVRPRVPSVLVQQNTVSMARANASSRWMRAALFSARGLFPLASRVVGVSNGVADDLVAALGLDRRKVDVIYSPIVSPRLQEAGRAPVSHRWFEEGEGPVLVAVGRLTEQKDFPTLLRALARLPADHRLIVLGEGERRDELTRLADQLGVADRVDLHGFVPNPYPFLAHADLLVQSSRWEGLPTVLIEALPFPCGIVATDCPSGPREILEDGRWGRIVPTGDPAALAAAIGQELGHRRRRPPEAWARYEVPYAVDRYVRLIDELSAR